ncbi:CapA family protein, partial [Chloroflexota bacterium]
APSAHILREADIAFGQLEVNFSERGTPLVGRGSPRVAHPKNVSALTYAGFDVISFASNHALDFGYDAFFDTIDVLKKNGIEVVGAGKNLEEARKPVVLVRKGTRIAFLAYNSILMGSLRGYAADTDNPGCNPLRAYTFYESIGFNYQPGTPAKAITFAYPEDKERMIEDIKRAKAVADVVVVSHHAGILHVRASIAMYQKEIAYAALDAGADIILQQHAHILKGIETYKGKVIFYGMGNFAFEQGHLGTANKQAKWSELEEYYGLRQVPEPGWELYTCLPESRKTFAAKFLISENKIRKVSYIPCYINQQAQAEILTRADERSTEVYDYVEDISRSQGLNVKFRWDGDEVVIV